MLLPGRVRSAHQASPFLKTSPSNGQGQQSEIPAAASAGRKSRAHAQDGRFEPAVDCRFPVVDCRFAKRPPLWRIIKPLTKVPNAVAACRDVDDNDRTHYVHESKETSTKGTPLNPDFCSEMGCVQRIRQKSVGPIGARCIGSMIIWDKAGPKIRLSAHPLIGPREEHQVASRWPDDPMTPWPVHVALHDVLETKWVSVYSQFVLAPI